MSQDPTDDALAWRRKYQQGIEELDRADRRIAELEETLRHSVARLARGAMGIDERLDQELAPLLTAVREERAPGTIAELASAIQEAGRGWCEEHSSTAGGDESATAKEGLVAELRAAIDGLIEHLPFEGELRRRAEELRGRLSELTPAAGITEASELAAVLRKSVDRERDEMRRFLELLDGRLQGLGELMGEQAAETLAETKVHRLFGERIDSEVVGMRKAVESAAEVEPLRRALTERLAAIESGMSEFLAVEAERRERMEATSRRANERLAELQRESAELNDRLLEVREAAARDGLTGCFNRASLDARLEEEVERFGRGDGPLSLIIADVDHFKRVNDTHGHLVGDKLLRAVAGVLQRGVRAVDFVARFGGEEFVLLLPETDLSGAAKLAEELRGRVKKRGFLHEGQRIHMTMSFGVTDLGPGEGAEELLARADRGLYAAKEGGRDRVRVERPPRAA